MNKKKGMLSLNCNETFSRRLFGVEETFNLVLKEFKERQGRIQELKSPTKNFDQQLLHKAKNLDNQLELVKLKR